MQHNRRNRAGVDGWAWHRASSHRKKSAKRRGTHLRFETLEPRCLLAGVVINEFLAVNSTGITDQDGDRSDWIEVRNTDAAPVNLAGWYLTDDSDNLTKWQFPSTPLAGNGYLTIFASGKNRPISGQQLHTNFSLDPSGEYLALVMPDGVTVANEFAPYPSQLPNVSYGLQPGLINEEPLVDEVEAVRVHAPANGNIGTAWTQLAFDDSQWLSGDTGIGYERSPLDPITYGAFFTLDVDALMPANDTLYSRIKFNTVDVDQFLSLELSIRYDDAFVAYLNGQEITRRNFVGTPQWNSSATSTRADSDAIVYETIDVSAHLDKLVEGDNVLAIHGLNASTDRSDFLLSPMLIAERQADPIAAYMTTPTPGAANLPGTLGVVADTNFSVDRGFYDAPFVVEITTATAGAEIRYTLNGSEPTATTGFAYNPLSPPVISTTTTLRAAAFKAGWTPTNIDTQTYIFLDHVLQQNGSGVLPHQQWGHAGPDWAMDPNVVNSPTYSGRIKDDMKSVASVSVVMPWETLFGPGGIYIASKNVERPGSVELFNASGSENLQIDAAVEIMGGTSTIRWRNDKLSFRITFKEPFGPTSLDADLFNHPLFDQGATDEFDTFILDAVYNQSWTYGGGVTPQFQRDFAKYIQDQYVADLQNLAGGHAPHGRYIHLYLNGLYWGMYYLHERPDDSFAEAYLGGDKDDYDVLKHTSTEVVSGDTTAAANYAALLNLVRQNMSSHANYVAVTQKLDIDQFIDYMLVNYYVGNTDWAHHNWYATYNRVAPDGKWRFHSWDAEHVLENFQGNDNATGYNSGTDVGSPAEIHDKLMANVEYRLRFSDRVQKHFRNGGLFTPAVASALYQLRMQDIDSAIVGESARWGDNQREPQYTRQDWLNTQNGLISNYFPLRTNVVLNQMSSRNWLVSLAAPNFSQYGGEIGENFSLTLSKPGGSPGAAVIYYTLDGSDPRLPQGGFNPAAQPYSAPIPLDQATRVRARIYFDNSGASNDWSAEVNESFFPPLPFPLRITELHYNPAPRSGVSEEQDMEFFELMNTGSQTVSLNGVQITSFANDPYVFGPGLELAAGQRIIVAKNPTVFQQVYGTGLNVAPAGYGTDNLSNGGERVVLLGPLGEVLQDFTFDDSPPWPTAPDGNGPSLEIIDPLGNPANPANWRASAYGGGSPGGSGIVGDYDGSGTIDEADRDRWRAGYGRSVFPGLAADGNGDGTIDAADYVVWRYHFNENQAATATTSVSVVGGGASADVEPPAASSPVELTSPQPTSRSATVRAAAIDNFFNLLARQPDVRRAPAIGAAVAPAQQSDELLIVALAASERIASDALPQAIGNARERDAFESVADEALVDFAISAESLRSL